MRHYPIRTHQTGGVAYTPMMLTRLVRVVLTVGTARCIANWQMLTLKLDLI